MSKNSKKLAQEYLNIMFNIKRSFHKISSIPLKHSKLTPLQMQAMHLICITPEITVGDLAEQLFMSSAAIAQLTDRLIKMNWISRKSDANDRRVIRLRVTKTGTTEFEDIKKTVFSKMQNIMALVPEKDLKEMIRITTNLLNKLEEVKADEDIS